MQRHTREINEVVFVELGGASGLDANAAAQGGADVQRTRVDGDARTGDASLLRHLWTLCVCVSERVDVHV